jgi:hypothetical protein
MPNEQVIPVIFSYNRAMQLDATLNSYFKHCLDIDLSRMFVIYRVTTDHHEKQYKSLIKDYPQVTFLRQSHFRSDLINIFCQFCITQEQINTFHLLSSIIRYTTWFKLSHWLIEFPYINEFIQQISKEKYILFMVDDNLFTLDFSLKIIIESLKQHNEALGFSLRLGRNTQYCYANYNIQEIPDFLDIGNNVLEFNWTKAKYDFNYPFEVSSSIYPISIIFPLLLNTRFNNPNTLEVEMSSYANLYCRRQPDLLCFSQSVSFCNPINIIQSIYSNRVGKNHDYSIESLAERFDQGERIDVDILNGFVSNGCHQEVVLKFKQK